AEDHARREVAEARNTADQLTYQVDKAFSEYGDKIPESEREAVVKANDEVKEALKGDDVARIRSTTDALMEVFQRVGQAMYAQQGANPGAPGGTAEAGGSNEAASSGDGDVV